MLLAGMISSHMQDLREKLNCAWMKAGKPGKTKWENAVSPMCAATLLVVENHTLEMVRNAVLVTNMYCGERRSEPALGGFPKSKGAAEKTNSQEKRGSPLSLLAKIMLMLTWLLCSSRRQMVCIEVVRIDEGMGLRARETRETRAKTSAKSLKISRFLAPRPPLSLSLSTLHSPLSHSHTLLLGQVILVFLS